MAGKPRSEWSDTYRKRVERAEAAGKSRQAARGHRGGEHVTRRTNKGLPPPAPRKSKRETQSDRNARSIGALTQADKSYVRRQVAGIALRSGDDPDDLRADLLAYATRVGIDHFKAQIKIRNEAAREYRGELNQGAYTTRGTDLLDLWQADDGFPDVKWYYYH